MRYWAFISYSHADEKWARWLHRALESYRVPKAIGPADGGTVARLAPIFRDRDELPSSADLSETVNSALRDSRKLIVLCSPASAASRWVNEEIRTFRRFGRTADILCLVVGGEPSADDAVACLPPALRESGPDIGNALEPLAADARPVGDGRRRALLKIVAGMLDVGFDALAQRDQRRRYQRLLAATAGSLAIAGVTVALAITATLARQDAEQRRTEAENLIDYLLGDLTDRLYEIGRLDIYDSIGDEAFEYFAAQSDEDNDRVLAQRAKSLRRIGEVRMDQANLNDALLAFRESLSITTRLAERNEEDPAARIDLAHSHFYVGHVSYLRGDLEAARDEFELVLAIVDTLHEREPDNPRWLDELGLAHTNLGRVLELEGSLDEAITAYERVMAAYSELTVIDSSNEVWRFELAFAHGNLGSIAASLGRLDEAGSHYRADIQIKQEILDENPDHNTNLSYLAVSRTALGKFLIDLGEFEEAEEQLSTALGNFDYLLGVEPSRTNWQMYRANVEREIGRLYHTTGRTAGGRRSLQSATRTLAALVASDEGNVETRRHLAWSLLVTADFEARSDRQDAARAALDEALDHLAWLDEQETENVASATLSAHADIYSAAIASADDPAAAAMHYGRALERLEQRFAESRDPKILELRLRAFMGLGRGEDAAVMRERLRDLRFYVGQY